MDETEKQEMQLKGKDLVETTDKEEELHGTEPEADPWKLPEVEVEYTKWSELTFQEKLSRVCIGVGKVLLLIVCLYFFISCLDLISSAFRLIAGKTAGSVFKNNAILSNPVAGLMIGVLATSLLQSSSTTTGIAISLVVSNVMTVRDVIPIVMGANIGTSITNTLVSMGQLAKRSQFRRAFAGATVHDMFNWMAVIVLLPLETATGYLYHLTRLIVSNMKFPESGGKKKSQQFVKAIIKPFTSSIIMVDKKILSRVAKGDADAYSASLVKRCCKKAMVAVNVSVNTTDVESHGNMNITTATPSKICVRKCEFLFSSVPWSDTTVGVVLLLLTLVIMTACFIVLVRTLYSALRGSILNILKTYINADFPGKMSYLTGYVAIGIGTGVTMILQSSSVFTSALTPLVGVGILSVERMYPLTLGANLGTTFTAVIIALSQNAHDMPIAFHVALCHVFFNVSGVLIYYPLSFMRIPIRMAKFLGHRTAKYRWFAIAYLLLMFVVFPVLVFGLSSISWVALVCVMVPVLILLLTVLILNVLQRRCPDVLPGQLKTWTFLPKCLRSLEPYDRLVSKLLVCCKCCSKKPTVEEVTYSDNKV